MLSDSADRNRRSRVVVEWKSTAIGKPIAGQLMVLGQSEGRGDQAMRTCCQSKIEAIELASSCCW